MMTEKLKSGCSQRDMRNMKGMRKRQGHSIGKRKTDKRWLL